MPTLAALPPRTRDRPVVRRRPSRSELLRAASRVAEFYGGAAAARTRARTRSAPTSWAATCCTLTLKGARVALLIGGLTSLIVIPLALLFGVSAGYFGGRIDDAVFFLS